MDGGIRNPPSGSMILERSKFEGSIRLYRGKMIRLSVWISHEGPLYYFDYGNGKFLLKEFFLPLRSLTSIYKRKILSIDGLIILVTVSKSPQFTEVIFSIILEMSSRVRGARSTKKRMNRLKPLSSISLDLSDIFRFSRNNLSTVFSRNGQGYPKSFSF